MTAATLFYCTKQVVILWQQQLTATLFLGHKVFYGNSHTAAGPLPVSVFNSVRCSFAGWQRVNNSGWEVALMLLWLETLFHSRSRPMNSIKSRASVWPVMAAPDDTVQPR